MEHGGGRLEVQGGAGRQTRRFVLHLIIRLLLMLMLQKMKAIFQNCLTRVSGRKKAPNFDRK